MEIELEKIELEIGIESFFTCREVLKAARSWASANHDGIVDVIVNDKGTPGKMAFGLVCQIFTKHRQRYEHNYRDSMIFHNYLLEKDKELSST